MPNRAERVGSLSEDTATRRASGGKDDVMANYNKVILAGNLTRDPQMRFLPSQTPVVELGLAVNRRYRTREGEQREETCFIDCYTFGRQAEVLNQYCRKGKPLLVEGRLQLDTWEQNGQKRSRHRVFIENFQFLGGPTGGGGGGQGGSYNADRSGGGGGGYSSSGGGGGGGGDQGFPDNYPTDYPDEGGDSIPF
jgi:single-strand DNA-binding protein